MGRRKKLENEIVLHSRRLLADRRVELYEKATPLLASLEEAVGERNVRRIIETFAELRRLLHASIAYLNRSIYRTLRGMEEAVEGGGGAVGGIDPDQLRLEVIRMHVEFGKAMRAPAFEPVEEILDLDAATRVRLMERAFVLPARSSSDPVGRALHWSRRGWDHLGGRRYRRAARSFRKAVSSLPDVPRFRAELAAALLLAGRPGEAVAEAEAALRGYEMDVGGEPAERRATRRTLGRALRAAAEQRFRARHIESAIGDLRRAIEALEASLDGEPEGPEVIVVRGEVDRARDRLGQWEEIRRKISGIPTEEGAAGTEGRR